MHAQESCASHVVGTLHTISRTHPIPPPPHTEAQSKYPTASLYCSAAQLVWREWTHELVSQIWLPYWWQKPTIVQDVMGWPWHSLSAGARVSQASANTFFCAGLQDSHVVWKPTAKKRKQIRAANTLPAHFSDRSRSKCPLKHLTGWIKYLIFVRLCRNFDHSGLIVRATVNNAGDVTQHSVVLKLE